MHLAARISIKLAPEPEFYLTPKAVDTLDLLLFFDKLFDTCEKHPNMFPFGNPACP
jgi:hypothetical protein